VDLWEAGKEHVAGDPYKDLNLEPPERSYELWRHRNADNMGTSGWSGLYWARPTSGGDYEIRTLAREGEAYFYPGGIFPKEAFERLYERVDPGDRKAEE
jgi:hypothetical protein